MPRFDGTGPEGLGKMSGWGRGYCLVPLDEDEMSVASAKKLGGQRYFCRMNGLRGRGGYGRRVIRTGYRGRFNDSE